MTTARNPRHLLGLAIAGVLVLGACSDDENDAASADTTEIDDPAGEEEFCALAEELAFAEGLPTAEQAARYAELAPDAIRDDALIVTHPPIEHEGDEVAIIAAFADDDVEAAFRRVNEDESDRCGFENAELAAELQDVDPSANRVDVVALDYAFEHPAAIPAGRTSFVLRNDGAEAHFLLLVQLAEGHTMDEALAYEGDPREAGLITDFEVGTAMAAPGGDEEVVNVDLEPGDYAMVCFVPGPDGAPHALMGMASALTVT